MYLEITKSKLLKHLEFRILSKKFSVYYLPFHLLYNMSQLYFVASFTSHINQIQYYL